MLSEIRGVRLLKLITSDSISCDVNRACYVTGGSAVVVTDLAGQLTVGAAAAAAAGTVEWDKTSVVAHQGDNVTLVCTVRPLDFFDVVRLTLTPSSDYVAGPGLPHSEAESTQQQQQQQQRWTIADNDVVKPPFLALPRYGVTMTLDGRQAVIQLTLYGLYRHASTICRDADISLTNF